MVPNLGAAVKNKFLLIVFGIFAVLQTIDRDSTGLQTNGNVPLGTSITLSPRDGHIVRTENSEKVELERQKNNLLALFCLKTIADLKRSRRVLFQTYLGSVRLSKNILKKVRASWGHSGNFGTWQQKNQ